MQARRINTNKEREREEERDIQIERQKNIKYLFSQPKKNLKQQQQQTKKIIKGNEKKELQSKRLVLEIELSSIQATKKMKVKRKKTKYSYLLQLLLLREIRDRGVIRRKFSSFEKSREHRKEKEMKSK